jgi:hypothetical protein
MTSSGDGAMFYDLDDPSPPRAASTHRAEVARRVRRVRHQRQIMFSGLAVAIVFGATFTAVSLRTPAPVTTAVGAASGASNQMFWPTVGSPDPRSAPPELSPLGPSMGVRGDATTGSANGGAGALNSGSSPLSLPATTPTRCPTPTWEGGQYCGPAPQPGNGNGSDGKCSGNEPTAPCGPGAVVGTYYAYTLPVRCDGRITFDGRRWDSELPPPANGAEVWVWMRLEPGGHLRFVAPNGTVGFNPDRGKPPPSCNGTP